MNVLGHAGFSSYIGWTNRYFRPKLTLLVESLLEVRVAPQYLGRPEASGRELMELLYLTVFDHEHYTYLYLLLL